ncbi:hypothetical protein PsalBI1_02318 [Piscirickettsia salmonis]|nr:hypothetical protein PsalBI1_02318 [Piscirickettsia salmonis]
MLTFDQVLNKYLEYLKKACLNIDASVIHRQSVLTTKECAVGFQSISKYFKEGKNKFAQNSIYLSSQQATRYFGKLPLRVVMRFVFFRSKLRGIRPLAIESEFQQLQDKLKKLTSTQEDYDQSYNQLFEKFDKFFFQKTNHLLESKRIFSFFKKNCTLNKTLKDVSVATSVGILHIQ